MAPERSPKRQKTSLASGTGSNSTLQPSQIPIPPEGQISDSSSSAETSSRQQQRSSWYSSWSRKAAPVTEVAREGIKSASNTASEAVSVIKEMSSKPRSIRSPSLAMTLGKGRPSRASLADVTTTMVHAEASSPGTKSTRSMSMAANEAQMPLVGGTIAKNTTTASDKVIEVGDPAKKEEKETASIQQGQVAPKPGWLGWLAKADGTGAGEMEQQSKSQYAQPLHTNSVQTPSEPQISELPLAAVVEEIATADRPVRKGWLPSWTANPKDDLDLSASPGKVTAEVPQQTLDPPDAPSEVTTKPIDTQSLRTQLPKPDETQTESSSLPRPNQDDTKPSAWAFWSRDRKTDSSSNSIDKPREGEIAISNTASQDSPRRASIEAASAKEDSRSASKKSELKKPDPQNSGRTEQPAENVVLKLSNNDGITAPKGHKKQVSKVETAPSKPESPKVKALAVEPAIQRPESTKSAKVFHNLLLPDLEDTLEVAENPSLLLRLANLFYAAKDDNEPKHLWLVKDPPQIKNALAIGVHGYFPTSLIRSVLGQPTGTSIKFADMAAKSIRRWTSTHGYDCQVKTAALEGEGKIADRVDLLWKLLLNWIEEVRKSDFIMVACHSQGVPVAIMLVAKLVQFGCVGSNARVCICAMAGINMGPFQEYKSRWIGGSAGELFEFSDSASRVSTEYIAALDVVLKFGVRLTLVGSIDDQLVSLESSIFAPITHPHIFRAVSIDSRVHAPNFLSHLVGFALKLRNLGVQDHGLIRELSSPLAGSLYTGEGHSRIYEDDAVYDLAVSFAMRTDALVGTPLSQRAVIAGVSNPYILPFAMRGILEEEVVKHSLYDEVKNLLKEFDEWKPTSKTLKDVKFRLEGIRSQV